MGESEKYAFRIDGINPNSTHGKILMQVPPKSVVLEFGSASGYMTKYMTQHLNCLVDIVEIDKHCFERAKAFCRFGVNGDIDGAEWYEMLAEQKYDRILFADVLEHLKDPWRALFLAGRLLKDDGKIVFSIPNICHNDIIIKMIYNYFTYTDIGLLDDTHLHFFGLNDIPELLETAKLSKDFKIDCIMYPTQTTEQKMDMEIDPEVLAVIKRRGCIGDVYQWIVTCHKP